jgi:hypothetical protein
MTVAIIAGAVGVAAVASRLPARHAVAHIATITATTTLLAVRVTAQLSTSTTGEAFGGTLMIAGLLAITLAIGGDRSHRSGRRL